MVKVGWAGFTKLGPGQITALAAALYLIIALLALWRIPDLHPELADLPERFYFFVRPGTNWDPNATRPYNIEYIGYDGQWFYDLARDPFQPTTSLDKPAYRSARLLYPLLVRLVTLGQSDFVPIGLMLVNYAAILGATYLLARLLLQMKLGAGWAWGYVLWPGTLCAFVYDLSEPLCFLLIIAALNIQVRRPNRVWAIGGLLLLASLTKELALLFGLGWLLYYLYRREWRNLAILGISWLLPFAGWQFSLWLRFGRDGLSSGQPFSWLPLGGFIGGFSTSAAFIERLALLALTIIPTFWASGLVFRWLQRGVKRELISPWPFFLLMHMAFLLFLPTASFIYLIDHARNLTGLALVIYLFPLGSFERLRGFLLITSLILSGLLLSFYIGSGNAFLYSFGW